MEYFYATLAGCSVQMQHPILVTSYRDLPPKTYTQVRLIFVCSLVQINNIKISNLCSYILDDKRSLSGRCIAQIYSEHGFVYYVSGMYELLRSQMEDHYKQSIALANEYWEI